MKSLLESHQNFIDLSRRTALPGRPPIVPRTDRPVVAREKWTEAGEPRELVKTFQFRRANDKLRFVQDVMEFEEQVGHHAARMVVQADKVTFHLRTLDVDRITELDKELAQFADACFKDIAFSSQ
jgi:pterin-4a-carbinolamine dehydratase